MPYNYCSQNNDWRAWRGLSVEFCINQELGQKVLLKLSQNRIKEKSFISLNALIQSAHIVLTLSKKAMLIRKSSNF